MGHQSTQSLGLLSTLGVGLGLGLSSTHHLIQEGNAAGQLRPRGAEFSEQQAPNGLPLA